MELGIISMLTLATFCFLEFHYERTEVEIRVGGPYQIYCVNK